MTVGTDNGHSRGVTIKDAAKRLGITPIAVRKRVLRGTLPAEKDGNGQWWVSLPESDVGITVEDGATVTVTLPTGIADGDTRVVTHLREEVEFLRRELERRSDELRQEREGRGEELRSRTEELRQEQERRAEELRRKDILLAEFAKQISELSQRLPELPATTSPLDQPSRSWWQRLFGTS
jgi:regulator of protease activity HflC (stomatin/prohibitin superfamily)